MCENLRAAFRYDNVRGNLWVLLGLLDYMQIGDFVESIVVIVSEDE